MMWIQVAHRDGHLASRVKVEGDVATVGRAFDNDVVVDDPHVAPHHLRIFRDEGGRLVAEDLGSVNGMAPESGGSRAPRLAFDREGVRIGLTIVRALEASHPVAPEVPLAAPRRDLEWSLGLMAAVALAMGLVMWLTTATETKPELLMAGVLMFVASVFLWGAFWALLARVFSGRARFTAMTRVAATGALAILAWSVGASILSYALAWRDLNEWRHVGSWLLVGAVGWMHLRVLNPKHFGAAATLVLALSVTGAAMVALGKWETRRTQGDVAGLGALVPPAFRIAPAIELDEFLANAEAAKRKVDASRLKEPESEGD